MGGRSEKAASQGASYHQERTESAIISSLNFQPKVCHLSHLVYSILLL